MQEPGLFDLIVEKNEGRTAKDTSAIIKLNGVIVAIPGDASNRNKIAKSVELKKQNIISVAVLGEYGSSIVLTISPRPKYTLYTNPNEPLLLSGEFPDGRTVSYFGEKNSEGIATALTSASITSREGEVTTYIFNNQSRLAEIDSPDGLKLKFKWDSDTLVVVTLISADGLHQVSAPVDFSHLAATRSGIHNSHPGNNRSQYAHALFNSELSGRFLPPLEGSLTTTPDILQQGCVVALQLIARACNYLDSTLFIPGVDDLVCHALAFAAAAVFSPVAWAGVEAACPLIMAGAELFCIGVDATDLGGSAESKCTRAKNFITNITNYVLGKGTVVSASLQVSPGGSYVVGQTVNGRFTLANRGRTTIVMKKVLIGGRLGNTCPNNVCPDFTAKNNITLPPGQAYNYTGTLTLSVAGTYTLSVAYQKTDGSFVMPVDTENGTINKLSISVQGPLPKAVVSTSLKLSPSSGTYSVGQMINGSFSLTNRGSANLVMSKVFIGGRLGNACPNNKCPDFSSKGNVTLSPGQTYNYTGTFTPSAPGSYSLAVAYQKTDGSWVMPVDSENGSINALGFMVLEPPPKLTRASPTSISSSPNNQTVYLYGTGLAKTLYCYVQFPNGSGTFIYIPLAQVTGHSNEQLEIKTKFATRGTYYFWASTKDGGRSNALAFQVR